MKKITKLTLLGVVVSCSILMQYSNANAYSMKEDSTKIEVKPLDTAYAGVGNITFTGDMSSFNSGYMKVDTNRVTYINFTVSMYGDKRATDELETWVEMDEDSPLKVTIYHEKGSTMGYLTVELTKDLPIGGQTWFRFHAGYRGDDKTINLTPYSQRQTIVQEDGAGEPLEPELNTPEVNPKPDVEKPDIENPGIEPENPMPEAPEDPDLVTPEVVPIIPITPAEPDIENPGITPGNPMPEAPENPNLVTPEVDPKPVGEDSDGKDHDSEDPDSEDTDIEVPTVEEPSNTKPDVEVPDVTPDSNNSNRTPIFDDSSKESNNISVKDANGKETQLLKTGNNLTHSGTIIGLVISLLGIFWLKLIKQNED